MSMIHKHVNPVPYELKETDTERRLFACERELHSQTWKGVLAVIWTEAEARIH